MGWRKAKQLAGLIRRFGRREDGVAAVEFALVAFPFCTLLLVIFETAIVLFTDNSLQNAVNGASRLIRTGQVQKQNLSQSAFRAIVCKNVLPYIDCSKIRLDVSKSTSLPFTGNVNMNTVDDATAQKWQVGGPSEWVMVQARYDWKLFMPWLSQLGNYTNGDGDQMRRLTTGVVFRNEPYGG